MRAMHCRVFPSPISSAIIHLRTSSVTYVDWREMKLTRVGSLLSSQLYICTRTVTVIS